MSNPAKARMYFQDTATQKFCWERLVHLTVTLSTMGQRVEVCDGSCEQELVDISAINLASAIHSFIAQNSPNKKKEVLNEEAKPVAKVVKKVFKIADSFNRKPDELK